MRCVSVLVLHVQCPVALGQVPKRCCWIDSNYNAGAGFLIFDVFVAIHDVTVSSCVKSHSFTAGLELSRCGASHVCLDHLGSRCDFGSAMSMVRAALQ
eukprot:673283-Rhodomonas_salina.1